MTRRGFLSRPEGSTAVEFAMIAPLFLTMLMGAFEFGFAFFALTAMERATLDAARFGTLGAGTETARMAEIEEIVTRSSQGLIAAEDILITVQHFPDFLSVPGPGETLNGAAGAGQADEVVVYRIDYAWDPKTPLFAAMNPITVTKLVVVQNEPD